MFHNRISSYLTLDNFFYLSVQNQDSRLAAFSTISVKLEAFLQFRSKYLAELDLVSCSNFNNAFPFYLLFFFYFKELILKTFLSSIYVFLVAPVFPVSFLVTSQILSQIKAKPSACAFNL